MLLLAILAILVMVIVPHSSLSEASVHVYGASCPKNSPTHSSPCVSRDLCISLSWLLSLISFFFLSISVSFPPRTPRSTLLIVFVPLPSSLSAPNLFSLSLIIPIHLHTHTSHLRTLLVLLTLLVVLARSLAVTEGRACKVVMAVLVQ